MTGKDDKEVEVEEVNKYWLELETPQVEFSAPIFRKISSETGAFHKIQGANLAKFLQFLLLNFA